MGSKTIPFINISSAIPLVLFHLEDGVECPVIVDSGSDATVFDFAFAKDNKKHFKVVHAGSATYTGVNSTEERKVVISEVNLFNDEAQFKVDVEVLNLAVAMNSFFYAYGIKPAAILGSEMLKKYDAKIDYEKKELTLTYDLPG